MQTVGRIAAFGVGCLFICLQVLAYFEFIEINWSGIMKSSSKVFDADGDGNFTGKDVGIWLRRLLSLLTVSSVLCDGPYI